MSALTWIMTFMCAAGRHLSSSSPAPRSPLVVLPGQNGSLSCNITSSSDIIWYRLRSDQLLPLLRLSQSRLNRGELFSNKYPVNSSHISWTRDPTSNLTSLVMLGVQERDAGLYFCSGWCGSDVCVNRGVHLKVKGDDENLAEEKRWQPCYGVEICVLPGLLGLFLSLVVGLYLHSGKLVCCCCSPAGQDSRCSITEEESLHYSSLRRPDKPRPIGRERPGFPEELVTYSAITSHKNFKGSHDQK